MFLWVIAATVRLGLYFLKETVAERVNAVREYKTLPKKMASYYPLQMLIANQIMTIQDRVRV